MKFLLCGCFHGRVPNKLIKIAKKEKVDYILSTGDFYSGDVFRDLIFKYFDKTKGTDFLLKEIIGAKRYNKLVKKLNLSGIKTLNKLNSLNIPIITCYGNHDSSLKMPWFKVRTLKNKDILDNKIKKLKNIKLIDYGFKKIDGYFIYFIGVKFPRKNKKYMEGWGYQYKVALDEYKKLNKFFKKMDPRKVILLSHEPPLNTRFDKVSYRKSPAYGKHVGDFVIKDIIKKYKPLIHISGHMHEHQGKAYLRKTLLISHGPAQYGKFALLELEKDKIKKLKFYK